MKSNTGKYDAKLVVACQSGNKSAWETLYLKYSPKLSNYFRNRGIRNREDVQDLVQNTLLEAMEKVRTIRKPESFNAWLFTIAKVKRAKWFEAQESSEFYATSEGNSDDECGETAVESAPAYLEPERTAINEEYMEIVLHLMEQFPQTQREALLLRATGMSYAKIAETLNIKEGNVKVQLNRGKKKLKALLMAKYPDDFSDFKE